jgi:uncharacterized repeat protein (TIGR03803 family)
VFKATTSGSERTIHSFGAGSDGLNANDGSGLLKLGSKLYGTTEGGGAGFVGTVFSVTTAGRERILHNFGQSPDGQYPEAGLIDRNGVLYGTTKGGGAYSQGAVFSISPSGAESVLYSFGGGMTDGRDPFAGLTDVNGTLYGTTSMGGTAAYGYGTVFALTP